MARKVTKSAIELLSDIGSKVYDLQVHSDADIHQAMDVMRKVNGPLFAWFSSVLAGDDLTEIPKSA